MNRLYYGDCLTIMQEMRKGSVDLIYLDPPFNSSRDYNAIYKDETGRPLPDQIQAFCDLWELDGERERALRAMPVLMREAGIEDQTVEFWRLWMNALRSTQPRLLAYLSYMTQRLLPMRGLLKPTGSIYLHCDPTASHYIKVMMDGIFGHANFRNEIIWCYTGPGSPGMRQFNRKHDVLLWYTRGKRWTFNREAVRIPHKRLNTNRAGAMIADALTPAERDAYLEKGKVPETWWAEFSPVGRLKKERMGYATQKPLALLDRIIRASSNEGDVVFDPFCGCATTLVAADELRRSWVGIDISARAAELVVQRIRDNQGLFRDITARDDIPMRADQGGELRTAAEMADCKRKLYGLQEGYCNGCQEHFEARHLEMDHVTPRAKGGTSHAANLQLLCGNCNRRKGSRTQAEFKAELANEKGINLSWL